MPHLLPVRVQFSLMRSLNTDIKGGVAITMRNAGKVYGKIGIFTTEPLLNSILKKVITEGFEPFSNIAYPKSTYNFNATLYEEHPELENRLTVGNRTIIDAKIFQKMPEIFFQEPTDNSCLKVYGRDGNNRVYKWIKRAYIRDIPNLHKYKVYLPGANNAGNLGETLSMPEIGYPETCHTQFHHTFFFF